MIAEQTVEESVRVIEDAADFSETRLEATGYVFHGRLDTPDGRRKTGKARGNLLHFARCPKLEKVEDAPDLLWFRSIRVAQAHLNEALGAERWHWCKNCQREITQRLLDEE